MDNMRLRVVRPLFVLCCVFGGIAGRLGAASPFEYSFDLNRDHVLVVDIFTSCSEKPPAAQDQAPTQLELHLKATACQPASDAAFKGYKVLANLTNPSRKQFSRHLPFFASDFIDKSVETNFRATGSFGLDYSITEDSYAEFFYRLGDLRSDRVKLVAYLDFLSNITPELPLFPSAEALRKGIGWIDGFPSAFFEQLSDWNIIYFKNDNKYLPLRGAENAWQRTGQMSFSICFIDGSQLYSTIENDTTIDVTKPLFRKSIITGTSIMDTHTIQWKIEAQPRD
jgi:hypothetical protein